MDVFDLVLNLVDPGLQRGMEARILCLYKQDLTLETDLHAQRTDVIDLTVYLELSQHSAEKPTRGWWCLTLAVNDNVSLNAIADGREESGS